MKETTTKPATAKKTIAPKTTVAELAKKAKVFTTTKDVELEVPETSEEVVEAIIAILGTKKAMNIVSVKVDHLTVVADYFIIASGSSTTSVRALAELVDDKMSKLGMSPIRMDGVREGRWAAIDFGSVIVHVFLEEMRSLYQLEKLWTDGTNIKEYNLD